MTGVARSVCSVVNLLHAIREPLITLMPSSTDTDNTDVFPSVSLLDTELCYNFCHLKGMTTMPPVLQAIDNMTSAEKIQTMDYLWTALEASSNDYTPPAWHARELARRRALYEAGKVPVYDWTEVKARLDARRNAR